MFKPRSVKNLESHAQTSKCTHAHNST